MGKIHTLRAVIDYDNIVEQRSARLERWDGNQWQIMTSILWDAVRERAEVNLENLLFVATAVLTSAADELE